MSIAVEGLKRFVERRPETGYRSPGVIVVEFGGAGCNKAGEPSCRDFCAVPKGQSYNPQFDPPIEMMETLFSQIAVLRPAVVSIVPNGEAVNTTSESNTRWNSVFDLYNQKLISQKQLSILTKYYTKEHHFPHMQGTRPMTPAEKMALNIALGNHAGLNLSLTTNGSFLTKNLLELYAGMGLCTINLSYHPNRPYDPTKHHPDLEHLITRADEAIESGIIPTITHVLTSKNTDTFVALADYVTEHDIFFAAGLAQGRGGSFSKQNWDIEPMTMMAMGVFWRLLARKLFADRHIRTTIPYLLLAPILNNWVCDQSTDFFHISVQTVDGKLQPKLNVCSEVRPDEATQLENFLSGRKLDIPKYLSWREKAMQDPEHGCPTCTHQCYFEAETRSGIDLTDSVQLWDYWDTVGKGLRQLHTFRHPVRPIVSKKEDFLNPYLWESLLQGVTRLIAKLATDKYWQSVFDRSHVDIKNIISICIYLTQNQKFINRLITAEKKDQSTTDWNDSSNLQSRVLRYIYRRTQKSSREGGLPVPIKFRRILEHQSFYNFENGVYETLYSRTKKSVLIQNRRGGIYPLVKTGIMSRLYLTALKIIKAVREQAAPKIKVALGETAVHKNPPMTDAKSVERLTTVCITPYAVPASSRLI